MEDERLEELAKEMLEDLQFSCMVPCEAGWNTDPLPIIKKWLEKVANEQYKDLVRFINKRYSLTVKGK